MAYKKRKQNKIVKANKLCCDVCSLESYKRALQKHTATFHYKYKCAVCDQGFNTQNLLRSHQLFAHPDYKEFKCNFCEYETSLKSSLNLHIKRKHNITSGPQKWFIKTKYECQLCHRFFQLSSKLRHHMAFHSDQKKFRCSLCQYATSLKINLKRHLKTHESKEISTDIPFKNAVDRREFSHNLRLDVVDTDNATSSTLAAKHPSQLLLSSSQPLLVFSNAIREEAYHLRSQILLASTISDVLSLLERLLELAVSIASKIRVSVEGDVLSQVVECFKYVWNTSELAVLRWKYVDDSMNRNSFFRAVQYAFTIFPAVSNLVMNQHLEIMEHLMLLITNTVRNYQHQLSMDPTARSNQSLPALSNSIREEAQQLRSQIFLAAPISSKLSLLERLLELTASIANQLRGFMAEENRSQAAECLEYVWAASKIAFVRWEEIEESTKRKTFLQAVQYAFTIIPKTFINLHMNSLDVMRHIMLLIISTVKNCQVRLENTEPGQNLSNSRLLWEGV
uniref:C2H2-type domain-containing protein n=1 Tax=Daphnia galeata TaxID=27404 RepID=A0A8J2W4E6_9CRUS|nr:unnamed protein product [Daphnia galeata]